MQSPSYRIDKSFFIHCWAKRILFLKLCEEIFVVNKSNYQFVFN